MVNSYIYSTCLHMESVFYEHQQSTDEETFSITRGRGVRV
jgi:hypothetical protein